MSRDREGQLVRMKVAGLALAAGLLMTACASGSSTPSAGTSSAGSSAPVAGGQITVADPLAPSSLDPVAGSSGGDQMSLYPIFDRLVDFAPKTLQAVPGLATSWAYPNPDTLVLELRHGVTFQDGTPFNASAVKFSIERALDPKTSVIVADLSSIGSVDVTGTYEVTIHLKQPDRSLPLIFADRAGMIVSPAAVKAEGANFAQHPVGAGPYSFVRYVPNSSLVLAKNPHYWQKGKPYLSQITFKYFTDQQTMNNALQSRQADIMLNADLSDVSTLQGMSGVQVVSAPSLLTDGCYLNFSAAPFSNVKVREAVAIAIDRAALDKSYAFGLATPTSEVFPAGYWAADPALQNVFAYDPGKARQLLAAAGYKNGLTIKGVVFQATAEIRRMEVIQQQLKAVGINLTFDVFDPATVAQKFFVNKAYDIACASWSGRPDPGQTASSLFASTSFYNAGGYAAPGMDAAIGTAEAAQSQQARAAGYSKITALNQKYVMWIPLLSEPNVTAINNNVKGLAPNLYGKIDVSFLWVG